jgi:hypothetical protein
MDALTTTDSPVAPQPIAPQVKAHGSTGFLILRLARFSWLGWLLFLITAGIFSTYVLVDKLIGDTVLVQDERGALLGQINWRHDNFRTDLQIISGAETWLRHYLSKNSSTVVYDTAAALSVAGPEFLERRLDRLKNSILIQEIEARKVRSWIEFKQTVVVERKGDRYVVRSEGVIVVDDGLSTPTETPFSARVFMSPAPRSRAMMDNQLGYLGFYFNDYRDN